MHQATSLPRARRLLPILLLAGATACAADATAPVDDAIGPAFARPAAGETDPTATWYLPLADAGLSLRSDGRYASGDASVYAHKVCGVNSRIFATTEGSNSGDATLQSDNANFKDRKCVPRTVTFIHADGTPETGTFFMNVRGVQSSTSRIADGETVERTMGIRSARCEGILFGEGLQGNGAGSTPLLVTRSGRRTFHVRSQEGGLAMCKNTGALFPASVAFTIVADRDLPYPGE